MTSVLGAMGLTVRRSGRDVVRNLDLDLLEGEVTALLGPNGAGKSTLLETLAGLVAPAAGRIERSGRVALARQSPDLARRRVDANVQLALRWWGVPRAERAARAGDALSALGAAHLAGRPAAELSGGERRRVHLARAVALRPDLLLLDEPFAGLDPHTRAALLDDTGAALRGSARSALVVVHDRAEAWALADRLLVMIAGRVVADGPPRGLLESPPSIEVARFLGFDGEIHRDGAVLLTRPHHVLLDPSGPIPATVEAVVPVEDGVRLALAVPGGRCFTHSPLPGPGAGDVVTIQLSGGVTYPDAGGAAEVDQVDPTVAPPAHPVRP